MKLFLLGLFLAFATVNADLFQLNFYMESQCPYCQQFSQTTLTDALKLQDFLKYVNLTIFPYGNAQESQLSNGTWEFTCQHGPTECAGNLILACGRHYYQNTDFLNFFLCLESSNDPSTSGSGCATKYNLNYTEVQNCVDGAEGNQLQHEVAVETDSLQPPHQYVPWVTGNGEPMDIDSDQLVPFICKNYQGTPTPPWCSTDALERFERAMGMPF